MRLTASLATFAIVIIAALGTAHALQCGDTIVTDTKLYRNIGPCPGTGLIIAASNVTLDLNGHAIIGMNKDWGVLVKYIPTAQWTSGVTIKGPGMIAGFEIGIYLEPSYDIMIYGLTLLGNGRGIEAGTLTSEVRVLNNTIIGKNRQTTGIEMASSGDDHIYNNTFIGHLEAIKIEMSTGIFVGSNLITQNETGIYSDFTGCVNVRGNEITRNRKDAVRIARTLFPTASVASDSVSDGPNSLSTASLARETCSPSSAVQGNTVRSNGGNGIFVYGGLDLLVNDNIVSGNSANGISVSPESSTLIRSTQVVGNYVIGNGTDLFWNGVGADNCWHRNIFKTSSPQTLPDCQ